MLNRAGMGSVSEQQSTRPKFTLERLLELGSAALLALATVVSAWCVYQAARWSGIQTFYLHSADDTRRTAAKLNLMASNSQLLDVDMFMHFITAMKQENTALQQFFLTRFRPEMRTAVDAWLATQPMTNRDAPLHPFAMPEYRLAVADQAQTTLQNAAVYHDAATDAKRESDRYTLLTVLLASVFFFAGIATHFITSWVKVGIFAIGVLAFLASLLWLTTCRVAP